MGEAGHKAAVHSRNKHTLHLNISNLFMWSAMTWQVSGQITVVRTKIFWCSSRWISTFARICQKKKINYIRWIICRAPASMQNYYLIPPYKAWFHPACNKAAETTSLSSTIHDLLITAAYHSSDHQKALHLLGMCCNVLQACINWVVDIL